MNDIMKRLNRLETARKQRIDCLYPDDSDNFITAMVGDDISRFARGGGYDAIAAISSTAADDWREYAT